MKPDLLKFHRKEEKMENLIRLVLVLLWLVIGATSLHEYIRKSHNEKYGWVDLLMGIAMLTAVISNN